jgi:membrane protein DedA with SNARE-associated domain/rhodanese-related sulfurtransferase
MDELVPLIAHYGLALVFANVLVERLGLPVPVIPTLVIAGALAVDGELSAWSVLAVAFAACLIGDAAWFIAGRLYGNRVMKLLCRISLSPDSCVRQAEFHFERWGGLMLPASKFLPGLAIVGPPLAGAMRMSWPAFLVWTSAGATLWAGMAIVAGMIFHAQITELMLRLEDFGLAAIAIVVALLAAYIGFKWWERLRFYEMLRVARITADELRGLMSNDKDTVVVDVRSPAARDLDPRFVPGALAIDDSDIVARLAHLPHDREIIFYCTCPNEASAAAVAKRLMEVGYTRVRPLQGGLDAWIEAGHEIERRGRSPASLHAAE